MIVRAVTPRVIRRTTTIATILLQQIAAITATGRTARLSVAVHAMIALMKLHHLVIVAELWLSPLAELV